MKRNLLLAILAISLLTACVTTKQVKDGAEITATAYVANEAVDAVQYSIGQYSTNQGTLNELDELQSEITDALQGGDALFKIDGFHLRATNIYHVLKTEAVERKDEMTDEQIRTLVLLNKTILLLDEKIKAFQSNEDNQSVLSSLSSLIEVIGTAKTVMSIYEVSTSL